jgi:Zn-dependent alcohol dehydrogenase
VKIRKDVPLERAALVGCGVTTGWGSATYAADVQSGESVAVVGLGGIGMSAVQGAAMAGARHVIAIDPVDWKREKALTLGATHTAPSMADAQPLISEITQGAMADKAILAVGLATGDLIAPMMSLVKKAGRGVVTAVANMMASDVQLNLFEMAMMRKELVGCIFGNANPRYDIPRLLDLYMDGRLKLDEMVTTSYTLDEINQGYQDMRDGRNIRGVIVYD